MAFDFEWDSGNLAKMNLVKRSGREFSLDELESVFEDPNSLTLTTQPDPISEEPRFMLIGMGNLTRVVSVLFVVRNGRIRVFNAWKTKGNKLKLYYAQKTN